MVQNHPRIVELERTIAAATLARQGPWTDKARIKIILVTSLIRKQSVERTLLSILDSTIQNFYIEIIGSDLPTRNILTLWTREDIRISYKDNISQCAQGENYTLVVPSGILFTRYSLEAILETSITNKIGLLRVAVDGHQTSVEFWNGTLKNESLNPRQIESDLKLRGLERWVSGEELGIYAYGQSKPKPFFGKGPAGQHTLQIVAYDSKNEALRSEIFEEEKRLSRQVQQLKSEIKIISKSNGRVNVAKFRIKLMNIRTKIWRA